MANAEAPGQAVEAFKAAVAAAVAESLATLRSTQVRGPYPMPTAGDLARSEYLRRLAEWGEGAALRSRRTLGTRGIAKTVAAARRLARVAALLSEVENAPDSEAAQEIATAALKEPALGGGSMPSTERAEPPANRVFRFWSGVGKRERA